MAYKNSEDELKLAVQDLIDVGDRIEASVLIHSVKESYLEVIDNLITSLNQDIKEIMELSQLDEVEVFVSKQEVKPNQQKERNYTLRSEDYYDVGVGEQDKDMPKLAVSIYKWARDFRDRRGIRQTWDQEMSEDDESKFYNTIYNLLNGTKVTEIEIDLITKELLKIPNMKKEWDGIDDDILEEIKNEWLEIFNK